MPEHLRTPVDYIMEALGGGSKRANGPRTKIWCGLAEDEGIGE
jgi:hypothetical protein